MPRAKVRPSLFSLSDPAQFIRLEKSYELQFINDDLDLKTLGSLLLGLHRACAAEIIGSPEVKIPGIANQPHDEFIHLVAKVLPSERGIRLQLTPTVSRLIHISETLFATSFERVLSALVRSFSSSVSRGGGQDPVSAATAHALARIVKQLTRNSSQASLRFLTTDTHSPPMRWETPLGAI